MATVSGGSIVWDLDVDSSGLDRGLNDAKSKIKNATNQTSKNTEKSFFDLGGSVTSVFSNITSTVGTGLTQIGELAVSKIGILGGGGLLALAGHAAFSASRVDELTLALHAIGEANNIASKETDGAVDSLRNNNISYQDALQITSRFIQSELKLTDAIKLSTVAKDLAVVAGMGSSEATNVLTEAISGQSPILLRQFGIVTTLDKVYEDYAKTIQGSSSVTSKSLTEAQKKQALLNVILQAGQKVTGTYEAAMESSGKQFRSFTSRILPDFTVQIGRAFEPSLLIIVNALSDSVKDMSKWFTDNKDKVAELGKTIAEVVKSGIDGFIKFVKFLIDNKEIVEGVFIAIGLGIGAFAAALVIANAPMIIVVATIVAIKVAIEKLPLPILLGLATAIGIVGIAILISLVPAFVAWAGAAIGASVATIVAFAPLIIVAVIIGIIVAAIVFFVLAVKNNWDSIKIMTSQLRERVVSNFQWLLDEISKIPGKISSALSNLGTALSRPFQDAWNNIRRIAEDIKNALQKINPFHRNSPSLVDNVVKGVGIIQDQYSNLRNIELPSISSFPSIQFEDVGDRTFSGASSSGTTNSSQQITVNIGEVKDTQDINKLAREIGFRLSVV